MVVEESTCRDFLAGLGAEGRRVHAYYAYGSLSMAAFRFD